WWPLFNGNATIKEANIVVDKTPPYVAVIANSYSIAHGGSALVVVEARDENLKDLAITDGAGHRFELFPFVRNHFYAALIAWPIRAQTFRAQVEGVDAAGNRVAVYIPFFLRSMNYKNSNITIDDKFLNGKIAELAMNEPKAANLDPVSRFKYVNETMRQANEELIYQRAHPKERELISDWSIQPFFPLPNGQVVASFGDHRFFYYGGQQISESWHLGIDLASTQAANVIISNAGKVRFAGYNGIYGNMPLIDHGLGLASLYGHCTTISVKEGDVVRPGQVIATTGVSGLALGDHLHFGLTVQGYEVLPLEWMDARWIKLNVSDVIAQAKIIIAGRPQ
ncbi:MAG: M23 family metallopeptidase, partial [Campylobacterales bacterium]